MRDCSCRDLRVGNGVDVHAFDQTSAAKLWLACLEWPGETPLAGHSDADVAAHAACDALLTASGLGDLGSVFGTSDPRWEGASGAALLAHVARLLDTAGWHINNVSIQVIGERPRMASRREEAAQAMSAALSGASVSLSATTTDHLGFLGRKEGLAAIATALVSR